MTQVGEDVGKMWKNHVLLVGLWHGAAVLEKGLRVSEKVKQNYRRTHGPAPGCAPKENRKHMPIQTCTSMLTEALFKTLRKWKQPVCLSTGIDKGNTADARNGMLLAPQKEWSPGAHYNVRKLGNVSRLRNQRPRSHACRDRQSTGTGQFGRGGREWLIWVRGFFLDWWVLELDRGGG